MNTWNGIKNPWKYLSTTGWKEYCFYCDRAFSEKLLKTKDHIHPKSKGGRNAYTRNMVACCSECNTLKDNMTLPEFKSKLEFWKTNSLNQNLPLATMIVNVELLIRETSQMKLKTKLCS